MKLAELTLFYLIITLKKEHGAADKIFSQTKFTSRQSAIVPCPELLTITGLQT